MTAPKRCQVSTGVTTYLRLILLASKYSLMKLKISRGSFVLSELLYYEKKKITYFYTNTNIKLKRDVFKKK